MKRQKMNSIQENYIVSKAMWEAVHLVQVEKYKEFLSMKGLTDDDIDDDNFDALNAEYDVFAKKEIENCACAWDTYRKAEQMIVDFGIAMAPVKIGDLQIREPLRKAADSYHKYGNSTVRKEIISLALKIDVSTLPEELRVAV
jgi:hypothetical protein